MIAQYIDKMNGDVYKNNAILSEAIVPSNYADYKANEFAISMMAHVVSSLDPGTYEFKMELSIIVSTPRPASDGSAAIEYDNEEKVIAEGSVKVQVDAAARDAYCKQYGRPKYDKGALTYDNKLEAQVKDLIYKNTRRKPVYIFANDQFIYNRGKLDRILSRQIVTYYVYTNQSGRCEVVPLYIKQNYDGVNYDAPVEIVYNQSFFPYGVCQNY